MNVLHEGHIKLVEAAGILASYAEGKPLEVDPEFEYLGVLLKCDSYERYRYISVCDEEPVEIAVSVNDLVREPLDVITWPQSEVMLIDQRAYDFLHKYCGAVDLEAIQFTKIKRD